VSRLRQLVLSLLKVPAEPQPPPGSADALRIFRASPRFFEYSLLRWLFKQVGALVGLVISFATVGLIGFEGLALFVDFASLEAVLLGGAAVLYVLQLPVSFVMLRFGYELRWYMVSDRALRIREGLYRVREQTMTVANIQNMSVRQGPLQKLFGIADLEVRTAGGGGAGKEEASRSASLHRGVLRGLDDAWEVRDVLRAALGRRRDAGLGDPDEAPETEGDEGEETPAGAALEGPSELVAAADSLVAEARALRRQWLGS
jgi:uncharacterized membrane protein YdbT with pleckstrin-like domain